MQEGVDWTPEDDEKRKAEQDKINNSIPLTEEEEEEAKELLTKGTAAFIYLFSMIFLFSFQHPPSFFLSRFIYVVLHPAPGGAMVQNTS